MHTQLFAFMKAIISCREKSCESSLSSYPVPKSLCVLSALCGDLSKMLILAVDKPRVLGFRPEIIRNQSFNERDVVRDS